jgi:hypothetical protein
MKDVLLLHLIYWKQLIRDTNVALFEQGAIAALATLSIAVIIKNI